jgi:hypothetical protein
MPNKTQDNAHDKSKPKTTKETGPKTRPKKDQRQDQRNCRRQAGTGVSARKTQTTKRMYNQPGKVNMISPVNMIHDYDYILNFFHDS